MSGNHSSPTNPGAAGASGYFRVLQVLQVLRVLRVLRVIERTKAISIQGNGLFHAQAEAFPISPPATSHLSLTSRAGKRPNSCAEGAPEAFRAEKGIISCAERDTHPPPEQKNTPYPAWKVPRRHLRQKKVSFPAQKISNTLHKSPQHHYFSVFGNFAFLKKNSQDKFTRSLH